MHIVHVPYNMQLGESGSANCFLWVATICNIFQALSKSSNFYRYFKGHKQYFLLTIRSFYSVSIYLFIFKRAAFSENLYFSGPTPQRSPANLD